MPRLLNTSALVNQVILMSAEEKFENIFVLHIAGYKNDYQRMYYIQ